MGKYVGLKVIEAEPQVNGMSEQEGYKVIYEDGYTSWSPKDVFEKAYKNISDGMSFEMAVYMLKQGYKVARKGWNGKNMFLFLRKGRIINNVEPTAEMVQGTDRDWFESRSHICMRDAEGKCVVGWLASQTDMLEDDWIIVE